MRLYTGTRHRLSTDNTPSPPRERFIELVKHVATQLVHNNHDNQRGVLQCLGTGLAGNQYRAKHDTPHNIENLAVWLLHSFLLGAGETVG